MMKYYICQTNINNHDSWNTWESDVQNTTPQAIANNILGSWSDKIYVQVFDDNGDLVHSQEKYDVVADMCDVAKKLRNIGVSAKNLSNAFVRLNKALANAK